MKVVNLYIGGCDLAKHYRNMLSEGKEYSYEINGIQSGLWVSMKEAFLSDEWDYVTVQQQSLKSTDYNTFQPYLDALIDYVRKMAPKAKLLMHQTWGYEEGSKKLEQSPYDTHEVMFFDIQKSYFQAKNAIHADGILPSGQAIYELMKQGKNNLYRDGFHLSYGFGRYLCGLVWYRTLTGNDVMSNTFRDFDAEVSEEDVLAAKQIAELVTKP